MKKLALSVALASAFASQYALAFTATPIQFNTQTNGVISVSAFDWSPDNALAVGATPLSLNPASPTAFTLYAQGGLASFNNAAATPILGTGLGSSYEITYQAGVTELGYAIPTGATSSIAIFGMPATTSVNFFNIYYDTSMDRNQLAGTGYGNGQLILSALILSNDTTFTVLDATNLQPLDGFLGSGNNYPTVGTVVGFGGGSLTANVQSFDSNFFYSDFSSFIVDLAFNTSNVTPFNQADPSASVVGNVPNFGVGAGPFSAVNGYGGTCAGGGASCDFLFQADANMSFQATTVPEPGTLALLGLGLAGLGLSVKRRRG